MTPLDAVIGKLENVRPTDGGFMARCPVHEADGNGHRPSLSIKQDGDRLLLHCFAGCTTDAIVGALGLKVRDLFADEPRQNANSTTPKLGPIVATYPYHNINGAVRYETTRHDPKDFRQRRPDGNGGWIWSIQGVERVPYCLPDLIDKTDVFWTEGEADVQALRAIGLTASTSCGGAEAWNKGQYAEQLVKAGCVRLNVLPDNDAAGRRYAEDVARSCAAAGITVKVVELPGLPVSEDVRWWLDAGHTKDELLALVAGAPTWTPAADPAPAPETLTDLGLDLTRLTDAHAAELLARRAGDVLRYDQEAQTWRRWDGIAWPVDHAGARQAAVVRLARDIATYALTLPDRDVCKKVLGFGLRLESRHGTDNCLELAKHRHPIAVASNVWDRDNWLLNTLTSTVDLHTAHSRPARPADLCQLVTGAAFDPQATAPRWLQFLDEVFPDDLDLIAYLQRWAGYALTGDVREQMFLLLSGTGANGKSVLLAVLTFVLGTYAYVAPFSTFARQYREGGNVASPELAALAGKRLISASEACEATHLDEGRIKSLTGGDTITARHLFGRHFSFAAVGKIILAANHRPRVTDDSLAFWRRCHVVPFSQSFTGADADLTLVDQLKTEASGILNWMLAGCLAWQRDGLQPPAAVQLASDAYRAANDPLAGFLADCTVEADPEDWVLAREAFKAYTRWADREELGKQQLGRNQFGERLAFRFPPGPRRNGQTVRGLKLVEV